MLDPDQVVNPSEVTNDLTQAPEAPKRDTYVVLVRDSQSLVLISAMRCLSTTPKSAATAVLSSGQTEEQFYERNDVEASQFAEASKAGKEWPGSLIELDHAGGPGCITIFDDKYARHTYEVVAVACLDPVVVADI